MFCAIVSHAGGAPDEPDDPAATTWPNGYVRCDGQNGGVAALITHGTADGTVGFDSGDFNRMYWGYLNGCQDTLAAATPAPCQEYVGCDAGKPVVWCPVAGGGHGIWPEALVVGWAFLKRF
jgi:poly(3-hydroxybutyrate) depolymerase